MRFFLENFFFLMENLSFLNDNFVFLNNNFGFFNEIRDFSMKVCVSWMNAGTVTGWIGGYRVAAQFRILVLSRYYRVSLFIFTPICCKKTSIYNWYSNKSNSKNQIHLVNEYTWLTLTKEAGGIWPLNRQDF